MIQLILINYKKKYDKLLKEKTNIYKELDNGYICDFKIMGVPSRMENIDKLKTKLKLKKSDIFLDTEYRKNPMWTWSNTATLPNKINATHRVIIQDDAIVCDDFKQFCHYLINKYPNEIFFLHNRHCFTNNNGEYGSIFCSGSIIGVVCIFPIKYINKIIECWKNKFPNAKSDDEIIRWWAVKNNINYLTTYPTCVDMIQGDLGIPSIINHSEYDRGSKAFIKNACNMVWKDNSKNKPIFDWTLTDPT